MVSTMTSEKQVTIPEGYKQTEVGVIPEDWGVEVLHNLVSSERRITYGIVVPGPYINNGIPLIRAQDYSRGWVDIDELYRVGTAIDKSYKRSKVISGDILLTIVGSVGKLAKVTPIFTGSNITQQTARLSFNEKVASQDFYFNLLKSESGKKEILNYTKSGVQPSLNLSDVEKFVVVCPPLKEQTAIANALSDVDNLITALEALIIKKSAIKTAAMQQLLTGKIRLPAANQGEKQEHHQTALRPGYKQTELGEIPEDWEVVALGLLADIKTGSKNNQDKVADGLYPFFVRSETVEHLNTYSYDCEAILVPGEGGIGSIFHYINGKFDAHQRVYVIRNFTNSIGSFIYYQMRQRFGEHAMKNSVKATVDSLRLPTFEEFLICLPSTKEQTAIANVLSDMDTELDVLQQRLSKTQQIKQGMMQELLTGKTRLVKPQEIKNEH